MDVLHSLICGPRTKTGTKTNTTNNVGGTDGWTDRRSVALRWTAVQCVQYSAVAQYTAITATAVAVAVAVIPSSALSRQKIDKRLHFSIV